MHLYSQWRHGSHVLLIIHTLFLFVFFFAFLVIFAWFSTPSFALCWSWCSQISFGKLVSTIWRVKKNKTVRKKLKWNRMTMLFSNNRSLSWRKHYFFSCYLLKEFIWLLMFYSPCVCLSCRYPYYLHPCLWLWLMLLVKTSLYWCFLGVQF